MGCNYYAHIIPSKERTKEFHDAIEANDFSLVKKLSNELYGRIELDYDTHEIVGGEVHLGKLSRGWKFLWNPNVFVIRQGHLEDTSSGRTYIPDPSILKYLYPLTKEGIRKFINREDVMILDEYGEEQDKDVFWQEALAWEPDGWDSASYEKEYKEHIYPVSGELTDLLRQEGYKFTSRSNSDFYSDGLRFAGYTDFS